MSTSEDDAEFHWLPILLEAFFVVLGVVLAFAANEWRESQESKEHAKAALASITQELESNRQAILGSLTYHSSLVREIATFREKATRQQAASQPGVPAYPDQTMFPKGYIAPADLLNTAWDSAAATDAFGSMDYDKVLALSKIYDRQHDYGTQAVQSGQMIYQRLFDQGHAGILRDYLNLSSVIQSFWYLECHLLIKYNATLDVLEIVDSNVGADVPNQSAQQRAAQVPEMCQRVVSGRAPEAAH